VPSPIKEGRGLLRANTVISRAVSSKMAPRILIVLIAIGVDYSFQLKFVAPYST